MTTANFLTHLRSLGVELRVDGNRLNCTIPKALLTPDLNKELKERKAEILAFLERADATVRAREPRLQPISRDGALPLSFAQQRLWFLEQLEPGSPLYNIPYSIRLTGRLDIAALERSLNEIVRRHESLRTAFLVLDGQPIQVISPVLSVTLPVHDLSSVPECETEALRRATEEAGRPFNLAQAPLLRAKLLRLAEEEHILLLTLHHMVSDGWSMGVLLRELSVFYDAFTTGKPSPLPALPVQYADFAAWQEQWLRGDVLDRQLAYWKRQLANTPDALELPTDRPRPAIRTFHGARQPVEFSQVLNDRLKAFSRRENVTLFVTLLSAFQMLLYRYSAQDDILIGSPIAGRNRTEIEGLIGLFINTLVLRGDLSGNPTFRELLTRTRTVALEAYAHQDLPFEKLVEELQPDRSLSHSPLFQVMFVFHNAPMKPLELEGLTVSTVRSERETAKFDLTLSMFEKAGSLHGSVDYNTDLFEAATINRMLRHYRNLLESIVANPEQRLSDLSILAQDERRQLLVEWNDTKADASNGHCIHQLFEEQVEHNPDRIAVVSEERSLDYKELNCRANQLAHYLKGVGVGPETPVAICIERSLEMIIGLLGILKAGGAYVPLDPVLPRERLAFMLEETRAPVLLTQQRLRESLFEDRRSEPALSPSAPLRIDSAEGFEDSGPRSSILDRPLKVVCLDTDWHKIAQEGQENPASGAAGQNLAYMLFTSGSTGKPKAVGVEHSQLVNYLNGILERLDLPPGSSFATVSTFAADLGNTAIFPSLCNGGCLHVVSQERASDVDGLAGYFAHHPIDCLKITPSHLEALLASSSPQRVLPRKRLVLGGEAANWELVKRVQALAPECMVINHYGPSEATVGVLTYQVQNGVTDKRSLTVPVGRPISNSRVYILDPHLQPVPAGVPGQLFIGGDSLARGYFNQPSLTAEKFVPNPFSDEAGARLYQTGDRTRYLPDGNVEFLDRIDQQVKIRGFRVELGEIEAVLQQHPAVNEAVVVAREDKPGDKRLIAYIVSANSGRPTTSQLRSFLKEKLPDYMLPSAFVMLNALPLTANGKLDRRRLPAPERLRSESNKEFVAPKDALELQLTKIWEKVLGVKPVGMTDNFFELGGHSLLAVRLFTKMEELTSKKLPLAALFQAPTIGQLSSLIREKDWSAPWRSLVPIQPGGSKPPFFCVHAHEGNVLFYRDLARYLGSDQPFYALQAQGLDGKQAPFTRVEDMAAHYIEEMRSLQPGGPYFIGGYCFGGLVAFEIARQLHAQGEKVALVALIDMNAPGYLKSLPNPRSYFDRFHRLRRKVELHLYNLSILGPEEKLRYLRGRLTWIAYRFYTGTGLPSVRARARMAILKAMREAARSYDPDVYSGHVTLLRATELPPGRARDPQLGWGKLAAGGVEVRLVPGYFAHTILEPSVRDLAEQLKACMSQAQSTEFCAQSSNQVSQAVPAVKQLAVQAAL